MSLPVKQNIILVCEYGSPEPAPQPGGSASETMNHKERSNKEAGWEVKTT